MQTNPFLAYLHSYTDLFGNQPIGAGGCCNLQVEYLSLHLLIHSIGLPLFIKWLRLQLLFSYLQIMFFLAHGQSYTGLFGTQLSGAAGCSYRQLSYRSAHFALHVIGSGGATIWFSCCPVTPRWSRLQVVFWYLQTMFLNAHRQISPEVLGDEFVGDRLCVYWSLLCIYWSCCCLNTH
jgi:hypothetical protein